ncbi:lysylphosphatidylglycerol synthase transmembrane domain-containing protein [Cyclobacterium marinum]|uniref:lysylphosphatidylglycerol synthase transmembrane domain-containing protein n=1 Tax=Cyclobacterium marinum TaxID=104 RepID=UPI0011EEC25E|nr:lysylphosphatidylglycerol synthase transmembrane domain-containing protein [Cyclobacterium marinum]MBI0400019.1 flippase-like domain-containing protein [Cyclobacterium marinum]
MIKKRLKFFLKILLTSLALYLVFSKIDTKTTWKVIQTSDIGWIYLAWIFFVASKLFSAIRLNIYFRDIGLRLPEIKNIKLYLIGMFYNLFLPGGIGGDGYKVYLLNKVHKTPVKQLINAALLDRGNGLAVLLWLMFCLMLFLNLPWDFPISMYWLGILGIVFIPIGFYLVMLLFFKQFMGSVPSTTGFSFLNQLLQLCSAYFILISMGVGDQYIPYLFVFLVSSTVSVLPLTIGGVGARELVFVLAHDYVGIDQNVAVAFSLLFFLISMLTSLFGLFFKHEG